MANVSLVASIKLGIRAQASAVAPSEGKNMTRNASTNALMERRWMLKGRVNYHVAPIKWSSEIAALARPESQNIKAFVKIAIPLADDQINFVLVIQNILTL